VAIRRLKTILTWVLAACAVATVVAGQEQNPAYIVLIDVSQSMDETPSGWNTSKLEKVRTQLSDFLTALPDGTDVHVYEFAEFVPSKATLAVTTPQGKDALRRYFERLRAPGTWTVAWDSLDFVLSEARRLLTDNSRRGVRVFMFSDGQDMEHPNDSAQYLRGVLAKYRDVMRDQNLRVNYVKMSFALGQDVIDVLGDGDVVITDVAEPDDPIIPIAIEFDWNPTNPTTDTDVQFLYQTLGNITEVEWLFGDDATSSKRTPTHRYAQAKAYDVVLRVKDALGTWHESTPKTIEVMAPRPIVARAEVFPNPVRLGDAIKCINVSDGGATDVRWDFGDGTTSTEHRPTKQYDKAKIYTITLTTARGDESDSTQIEVTVVAPPPPPPPPAPKAEFISQREGHPGDEMWFQDTSVGDIDTWTWDFGDASDPLTTRQRRVTHVYDSEDGSPFTVTLTVRGEGGEDSDARTVTIARPTPPVASFDLGSASVRAGDLVRFFDNSTGHVVRAVWDFGDGSDPLEVDYSSVDVQAARRVEHTYEEAREYEVTLSVYGNGGEDAVSKTVPVAQPPTTSPVAAFSVDVRNGTVPFEVQFTNQSKGRITKYVWDFDDGTELVQTADQAAANPIITHQYAAAGEYRPVLRTEGVTGVAPSVYELEGDAIDANNPFPWWMVGAALGGVLLVAIAIIILKRARRAAEIARARKLTGEISWKPTDDEMAKPASTEFHGKDTFGEFTVQHPTDAERTFKAVLRKDTDADGLNPTYTLTLRAPDNREDRSRIEPDRKTSFKGFAFTYRE